MNSLRLPNIYPIVSVSDLKSAKSRCAQLICLGAELIQIRDKSPNAVKHLEELLLFCLETREHLQKDSKIIINDHPMIAKNGGSDGVHLGRNDMPLAEARALLGDAMIIGHSCNTLEHLVESIESSIPNYLGIGPVFHSHTKSGHAQVIGLAALQKIVSDLGKLKSKPLVAIGGITFENIDAVLQCGVESVAMSSAIEEFLSAMEKKLHVSNPY